MSLLSPYGGIHLNLLSDFPGPPLVHEGPEDTQLAAIARLEETPEVVVRTPGGRDFWDIPPSEIAAVMKAESKGRPADIEDLYRRVLERYGVRRLTTKIAAELDRIGERFLGESC